MHLSTIAILLGLGSGALADIVGVRLPTRVQFISYDSFFLSFFLGPSRTRAEKLAIGVDG